MLTFTGVVKKIDKRGQIYLPKQITNNKFADTKFVDIFVNQSGDIAVEQYTPGVEPKGETKVLLKKPGHLLLPRQILKEKEIKINDSYLAFYMSDDSKTLILREV